MATITVKDKNGNDIMILIPDSVDPKSLGELTKTIKSMKPKRASEKSTYGKITSIVGSPDKKYIIFNTESDSFKYSFKEATFYHCKTDEAFAASHVNQMAMSTLLGPRYDGPNSWKLCKDLVPNDAENAWVKGFFIALGNWAWGGASFNDGMARRSNNNIRIFMEKSNVIQAIEPYVKTQFTLDLILNDDSTLRGVYFDGLNVKPFAEVYKGSGAGIDEWFTKHGSERVATSFYAEPEHRHRYTRAAAAFIDLGDSEVDKLNKFTAQYIAAKKNGYDDIFRIMWENHKIPLYEQRMGMDLQTLVQEHNYDRVALVNYVCDAMPRQGLLAVSGNFDSSWLTVLTDYVNMNKQMEIEGYDKYPRSIRLAHDVAQVNYNLRRMKIEEARYATAKSMAEKYAYADGNYIVIAPPTISSIIKEGTVMHHCVASYVPRILGCETIVMFMRHVDEPNKPLVTLEVRDGVLNQAKASHNKSPDPEQKKFLDGYKKHLAELAKELSK